MHVGEAAHDQVGLAGAAMPGPEQQPPPARVEAVARSGASGHEFLQRQKPGGCRVRDLYRAGSTREMSAVRPNALTGRAARCGSASRHVVTSLWVAPIHPSRSSFRIALRLRAYQFQRDEHAGAVGGRAIRRGSTTRDASVGRPVRRLAVANSGCRRATPPSGRSRPRC